MVFRRSSVRSSGGSMRSRATASKYTTRGRITRTQKSRNVGPSPVGKGGSRYPKHVDVRRERKGGPVIEAVRKTKSGYTVYGYKKQKPLSKSQLAGYGGISANREQKTIDVKSSGSSRILRKPSTKKLIGKARPKPSKVIRTRAQTVTKSAGIPTAKFKTLAPAAKSTSKVTRVSTSYKKTAKTVSKPRVKRRGPKVIKTTGARGKTKYKVAKRKIPKGPRKPRTPKSEFDYSI